KHFRETEV
nr:Chain C, Protein Tax-1 [Human T-cell leukemia virus type I]7QRS_D Chain D, Protein Tax-1 [Human T-cell leukemia virus type I]7QRT_C Chain C, Protein Tax-1 [Human T-cell leukemia virus type I]7QS8_C Chain C, Protein Tax-1 [Human T-cell leukemia virus type I]7QS8_D Chain D, Protein Tax-1 [Human T-cell leukemia virus type I]